MKPDYLRFEQFYPKLWHLAAGEEAEAKAVKLMLSSLGVVYTNEYLRSGQITMPSKVFPGVNFRISWDRIAIVDKGLYWGCIVTRERVVTDRILNFALRFRDREKELLDTAFFQSDERISLYQGIRGALDTKLTTVEALSRKIHTIRFRKKRR